MACLPWRHGERAIKSIKRCKKQWHKTKTHPQPIRSCDSPRHLDCKSLCFSVRKSQVRCWATFSKFSPATWTATSFWEKANVLEYCWTWQGDTWAISLPVEVWFIDRHSSVVYAPVMMKLPVQASDLICRPWYPGLCLIILGTYTSYNQYLYACWRVIVCSVVETLGVFQNHAWSSRLPIWHSINVSRDKEQRRRSGPCQCR